MIPIFVIILCGMAVTACSHQVLEKKYPAKPIQIVAAATPGGGWDLTAHALQKALADQHLVKLPVKVLDIPGAGGETGWKYVKDHGPNTLTINSSLILTNELLGRSKLTLNDFTPIAILAREWETVAVPKDSPFHSIKALMAKLKKDPGSVRIAVAPDLGNDDQIAFVKAAETYGVNASQLKFLVFESGGDEVKALQNHQVDAATMSVSEVKRVYEKGEIRMLVVSYPKPLAGLRSVPTWKDEGVNVVYPHWRGIMGPANMSKREVSYWDDVLAKMVKTKEWKRELRKNEWQNFYKNSSQTEDYLKQQKNQYKQLVKDIGLSGR